jgi:hypothetical protein
MITYKLDGVRYFSKEELMENMWEAYKDRMSRGDFEKYVSENMVQEEKQVSPPPA